MLVPSLRGSIILLMILKCGAFLLKRSKNQMCKSAKGSPSVSYEGNIRDWLKVLDDFRYWIIIWRRNDKKNFVEYFRRQWMVFKSKLNGRNGIGFINIGEVPLFREKARIIDFRRPKHKEARWRLISDYIGLKDKMRNVPSKTCFIKTVCTEKRKYKKSYWMRTVYHAMWNMPQKNYN